MARRAAMNRLNIGRRPRSGDPCGCAKCRGKLKVLNTEAIPEADVRIWYLGCSLCGTRPEDNKRIVPLEFFPRRERN